LYDFTAQTEYELSFKTGQTITLTSWDGEEWWTGEIDGKQGYPLFYFAALLVCSV